MTQILIVAYLSSSCVQVRREEKENRELLILTFCLHDIVQTVFCVPYLNKVSA